MKQLLFLLALCGTAYGQICITFGDSIDATQLNYLTPQEIAPEVRCVVHVIYHDEVEHSFVPESEVVAAMQDLNANFDETGISWNLFAIEYHNATGSFYGEMFRQGQLCPTQNTGVLNAYVLNYYWDTSTYCNIYITPWSCGSVLGWAFTAPSANQADGIFILNSAFGFNEERTLTDYDQNKTLTHEAGHYLSLRHIFHGIDYCGEPETNCEVENDQVCDTPRVKPSTSCLSPACPEGLYGYNGRNHMDYAPDSCRTDFTQGQIEKMMQGALNSRASVMMNQCLSDINQDGIVGTIDLLIILEGLGETQTVVDLIWLLSRYGNVCNN